jgi:hypothetical protein
MKGDIGPAITELRSAYMKILMELDRYNQYYMGKATSYASKMPVLGIAPKGRRKETGWYKPGSWESQTVQAFAKLGAMAGQQAIHGEVFLAGEILDKPRIEIVKVLFHQAMHQVSRTASDTSYHSADFRIAAARFGIEATVVDGWGYINFTYPTRWESELQTIADGIDVTALNVHRKPEDSIGVGTGKMRLWVCACGKPKLRTGAVLVGTCDICKHPYMYADKNRLCTLDATECPDGKDPNQQPHLDKTFLNKLNRAMIKKGQQSAFQRVLSALGSGCTDAGCTQH